MPRRIEESYPQPNTPEQIIVASNEQVLDEAVKILDVVIEGDNYATALKELRPNNQRNEDTGVALDAENEAALLERVKPIGIGRETDKTLESAGLSGAHVVIEGGLIHKIIAEAALVSVANTPPASYIFAASADRVVKEKEEAAAQTTLRRLGQPALPDVTRKDGKQTSRTEYDLAVHTATLLPGFEPLEEPEILPYSYDVEDYGVTTDPTGQFVKIGHVGSAPVIIMRMDRKPYLDKEGNPELHPKTHKPLYKDPQPAETLQIIDKVLSQENPEDETALALVSSSTYEGSRAAGAALAGLKMNRKTGVATYGTETLAAIKVTEPQPAPVKQVPGELYKIARATEALKAELAA